jgi:hypothetical protein
MNNVGFIILRHVNSIQTNKYWQECYRCVRNIYPNNKIVIIDDDSNCDFLTDLPMTNSIIVESEFKKRGELLPYYYYIQNKWFDNAVIIHDSVFIKADVISKYIKMNVSYKFLWHFEAFRWDKEIFEEMLDLFHSLDNHTNLLEFYKTKTWNGCFGGMSLINHGFLTHVNDTYNISNLLNIITNRNHRMALERVIACIFQYENKNMDFGILRDIIHDYGWGYSFDEYIDENNNLKKDIDKYPVIKVWTGR